MRTLSTALTVLALASIGVAAPAPSAQAAPEDYLCEQEWPTSRDGNVRAWTDYGCDGVPLGATPGNDPNWGDSEGAFQGAAYKTASSVMNSGFYGGRDVVAFYYNRNYNHQTGYVCLAPGERYADNLTDNYYYNNPSKVVNDQISSHRWVYNFECASGSWLT